MSETPRWEAELVVDAHARLGEGPVWCAGEAVLYWVDIDLGRVHRYDPATGTDEYLKVGEPVGAVVPTRSGGLALAAKSPAADQPHAGGLFRARPGVTGLPSTPYAL